MSFVKSRNTSILVIFFCLLAGLPAWDRSNVSAKSEDAISQAEALLALSQSQNYDNHALALRSAQKALALLQASANKEGIARAHALIGRYYFAQSDLPEATQNYENALGLWRDLDNPEEQAQILIMLGYVEVRKGEWSNSILLFTRAQSMIEGKNEPSMMGQIASGFADIFNESGLSNNALIQYQRALDYYRQTPEPIDDTMTIWALGSTYYLLGNYDAALSHLQQALAGVVSNSTYAAICSEYLGRVYDSMNEFPAALQHLQSALDIYTRAVNPREAARVRGLMAHIYQQQGNLEAARLEYQQALAVFRKLSDRINQSAICYAIGRLELKHGDYNAAEDYLRQSIEATENIRQLPTSRDLTAAFSGSVYERYENYIECLMLKHQAEPAKGFAARAFETSELARGRSLAAVLQATGTNTAPGVDPQLAAQERSLRQSLRAKGDYKWSLLAEVNKKEELATLDTELARLDREYKQLTETIRERYPQYEQITSPAGWNLQQIQEQVIADDQTLLLEYCLGSDNSYVWAVTRDGLRSYNLPAAKLIDDAAKKAYKLLASTPDLDRANELTLAIQELSQMVLSPIAAELTKRRIIVVADGALNYIPFQVLTLDNEPLVVNYEIINTPSASILGELRKEATQRRPAKVLAAFGDPVFASSYSERNDTTSNDQSAAVQALEIAPLQKALRDIELNGDNFDPSVIKSLFYAKRELANLRNAASSGETFVASGFTATRQQLLSMDLTQYAILHFATHGLLDPKRPENSGLLLSTVDRDGQAQNGFVGLQDIYGLHAPVDLVVLSACQTALGKDVRGEGLLGLTRGFMYAGASSVMASLWKVDDEATAELMRQTYTNMLRQGMTPSAALRAAQNSIRERSEWKSPYYWAGFTLQGEYRQTIQSTPAMARTGLYWKIIISGMLILFAGIALWYRYRRRRILREGA